MSERAWHSSGAYLLDRLPGRGGLEVTADYLRAYFARPELAPIDESCEAERVAHARLVDDPYLQFSHQELAEFEVVGSAVPELARLALEVLPP